MDEIKIWREKEREGEKERERQTDRQRERERERESERDRTSMKVENESKHWWRVFRTAYAKLIYMTSRQKKIHYVCQMCSLVVLTLEAGSTWHCSRSAVRTSLWLQPSVGERGCVCINVYMYKHILACARMCVRAFMFSCVDIS